MKVVLPIQSDNDVGGVFRVCGSIGNHAVLGVGEACCHCAGKGCRRELSFHIASIAIYDQGYYKSEGLSEIQLVQISNDASVGRIASGEKYESAYTTHIVF